MFAREAVAAPIAAHGDEVMFYTYAAHPAACAVADKVLEIVEREDLVARAARMGAALRERLVAALGAHPHVGGDPRPGPAPGRRAGEGPRDARSPSRPRTASPRRVVAAGLANGVFFYPAGAGAAQDAIVLGPPFTVSEAELDLLVTTLVKSIDGAVAHAAAQEELTCANGSSTSWADARGG